MQTLNYFAVIVVWRDVYIISIKIWVSWIELNNSISKWTFVFPGISFMSRGRSSYVHEIITLTLAGLPWKGSRKTWVILHEHAMKGGNHITKPKSNGGGLARQSTWKLYLTCCQPLFKNRRKMKHQFKTIFANNSCQLRKKKKKKRKKSTG